MPSVGGYSEALVHAPADVPALTQDHVRKSAFISSCVRQPSAHKVDVCLSKTKLRAWQFVYVLQHGRQHGITSDR